VLCTVLNFNFGVWKIVPVQFPRVSFLHMTLRPSPSTLLELHRLFEPLQRRSLCIFIESCSQARVSSTCPWSRCIPYFSLSDLTLVSMTNHTKVVAPSLRPWSIKEAWSELKIPSLGQWYFTPWSRFQIDPTVALASLAIKTGDRHHSWPWWWFLVLIKTFSTSTDPDEGARIDGVDMCEHRNDIWISLPHSIPTMIRLNLSVDFGRTLR
jgi:hypothetical protein